MCLIEIRLTLKYYKKRLADMTFISWSVALHRRRLICKKFHYYDYIRLTLKFQCIFEGEDVRALHKDDMDGNERFIYTIVWCEIFGYAYPCRYAHISLSCCH